VMAHMQAKTVGTKINCSKHVCLSSNYLHQR
jgi:hypothetical protein